MIRENSPVVGEITEVIGQIAATMNELSAAVEGVAEEISQVVAESDKVQSGLPDEKLRQPQLEAGQATQANGVAEVILRNIAPGDLARYEAQMAEAKVAEQLVEKKQELVQRREQPKQRVKKRDQGMEI